MVEVVTAVEFRGRSNVGWGERSINGKVTNEANNAVHTLVIQFNWSNFKLEWKGVVHCPHLHVMLT